MDNNQNLTYKSIQYRTNYGESDVGSLNYLTGNIAHPEVFIVGKGSPDVTPHIQINEGGKLISREHLKITYARYGNGNDYCWQVKNSSNTYESTLWYSGQSEKIDLTKQIDWVPLKNSTGIYIGPPEQGKEKGVVIEIYNEKSMTIGNEVKVDWDNLFSSNKSWFEIINPIINGKKIDLKKSEIEVLNALTEKQKTYYDIFVDSGLASEEAAKKAIQKLNDKLEDANSLGDQFVKIIRKHGHGAHLEISDK